MNRQMIVVEDKKGPSARTLRNRRRRQRIAQARAARPTTSVSRVTNVSRRRGGGGARKGMNPYLKCLLYPETSKGCKVPDILSVPSCPFQLRDAVMLTTNAQGNAMCMFAPLPHNGYAVSGAQTGADWDPFTIGTVSGGDGLDATFSRVRPVSASLQLEYIGDTNTDGGLVIGGYFPKSNGPSLSVAYSGTYPFLEVFPLRQGVRTTWRPVDNNDMEYTDTLTAGLVAATWPSAVRANLRGCLFICILGAKPNTALGRVVMTANLEGIPATNTLSFISPTASPHTQSYIEGAYRDLSNLPWASAFTSFAGLAGYVATQLASNQLQRLQWNQGMALVDV